MQYVFDLGVIVFVFWILGTQSASPQKAVSHAVESFLMFFCLTEKNSTHSEKNAQNMNIQLNK